MHKLPIWLLVIPLLLFSTALVTLQLGADSLDDDEKNSVKHLVNFGQRFTLDETIQSVRRTSPEHVPGFHLQLSLWSDLVGLHFVSLRAMLLFYFALSVAMAYRLARDLFTARHGVIAAFIVAVSGFHMHYGHEIRMYAPVVLQTMVLLWSYWRIMVSPVPTRWYHYVLLLCFSIYGIYTHNLIFFPLVGLGIYHLLFASKTRQWLIVAGVEVIAGITFLPWLPNVLQGASGFEDLSTTNQTVPEILFNSMFVYSNGFWIGMLLLIALALWKFPRKNSNFRYVLVTLLVMIVAMLIFNEAFSYIPSRRMRYTLISFPSLAMVCSVGLMVIYQHYRWLASGLLAIWFGMLFWFLPSDQLYHYANLERWLFRDLFPFHIVGEEIKNHYDDWLGRETHLVMFDSEHLYQANLLNYYETIYHKSLEYFTLPMSDAQIDRFDKIDNSFPGFWLAYRPADEARFREWVLDEQVENLFETYHNCLPVLDTEQVYLAYYLDNRLPCELIDDIDVPSIRFNNGYVLRQSVVEFSDAQVTASLLWGNLDQVFDGSYGFSLQVFHEGEKVGQTDYPIDNIVTHRVIDLSQTDTGLYSIQIIVYSSGDVSSVGGTSASGAIFEREVEIANFEIAD